MSEEHLTVQLSRLAPHTHIHTPKEMVATAFILALQLGRERRAEGRSLFLHLSSSCGLVKLVRWRDSNPLPQRSTKHQGPGTTQRTPASTGTDQTRRASAGRRERQQARRGFFSFSFFPFLFTTGRTFPYPLPPPRVEGTALGNSPPDWTRGCRATRGRPSLVRPNTSSGSGGASP